MTEHVHDWGEWEDTFNIDFETGERTRRDDVRVRECPCGQWETEWAEDEETK